MLSTEWIDFLVYSAMLVGLFFIVYVCWHLYLYQLTVDQRSYRKERERDTSKSFLTMPGKLKLSKLKPENKKPETKKPENGKPGTKKTDRSILGKLKFRKPQALKPKSPVPAKPQSSHPGKDRAVKTGSIALPGDSADENLQRLRRKKQLKNQRLKV